MLPERRLLSNSDLLGIAQNGYRFCGMLMDNHG
jgi:hypothetical protein